MSKSMIAKDALRPFGLKIDNLTEDSVAQGRAIIKEGAEAIGALGAQKVPKLTGHAASQIYVKQEDTFGNTWSITSRSLAGYLMQYGVKAHAIVPKDKALKIGNVIIKGPVKHPGVKARRWLTGAYKELAPAIFAQLEEMLGVSIRKK